MEAGENALNTTCGAQLQSGDEFSRNSNEWTNLPNQEIVSQYKRIT